MVGTTTHCDVMLQNVASCELTFHLSTSLHVLHVDCSHSNIDNPAGNDDFYDDDDDDGDVDDDFTFIIIIIIIITL